MSQTQQHLSAANPRRPHANGNLAILYIVLGRDQLATGFYEGLIFSDLGKLVKITLCLRLPRDAGVDTPIIDWSNETEQV